jgi:acyl dehydratase
MATRTFSTADLAEGAKLPDQVHHPTLIQSMMVQSATENYHRIHWDREFAKQDGLPDVIVSTGLIANWLAQLAIDWAGAPTALKSINYRFRKPVRPGQTVHVRGKIAGSEIDGNQARVTCDLLITTDDATEPSATGQAVVTVPVTL